MCDIFHKHKYKLPSSNQIAKREFRTDLFILIVNICTHNVYCKCCFHLLWSTRSFIYFIIKMCCCLELFHIWQSSIDRMYTSIYSQMNRIQYMQRKWSDDLYISSVSLCRTQLLIKTWYNSNCSFVILYEYFIWRTCLKP